jgi:hypothetical protein
MSKTKTKIELPETEYNKPWPLEKEFKLVKKSQDPRFGEVTIMKNHNTKEVIFVKEKLAHSKAEATNDIRNLKTRLQRNHPNLLHMLGYSTEVKKNLCSTSYLSRGFYRYPNTDMDRELKDLKKNGGKLSSMELNKLRNDIGNGLAHLHSKNLKHGDLRPLYIGKDKKTGNHQILDRFKDLSDTVRVQQNNLINKRDLYMSPQLYKKVGGKVKNQQFNPQKNDAFSLGMSMLQLGTQDHLGDCYQKQGVFDNNKKQEHLQDFQREYAHDPNLVNTVNGLLQEDENLRSDFTSGTRVYSTPPVQTFTQTTNYVQSTPNYVQSQPVETHIINKEEVSPVSFVDSNPYMVQTQPTTV